VGGKAVGSTAASGALASCNRCRQLAHPSRHVGPRRQARDQHLYLPLALPLRLGDDGVEGLRLEMRGEQPHRGEVQGTVGQ